MSEYSRRIVILVVVAVVSLACLCACCAALGIGGFEIYSSRSLTVTPMVGRPRLVGTGTPIVTPGVHRVPATPAQPTQQP
jgi:hypothetical protein